MTMKYYIIRSHSTLLAIHKTKDSAVALFLQMSADKELDQSIIELVLVDTDDYGKASVPILLYSYNRHFNTLMNHLDD